MNPSHLPLLVATLAGFVFASILWFSIVGSILRRERRKITKQSWRQASHYYQSLDK